MKPLVFLLQGPGVLVDVGKQAEEGFLLQAVAELLRVVRHLIGKLRLLLQAWPQLIDRLTGPGQVHQPGFIELLAQFRSPFDRFFELLVGGVEAEDRLLRLAGPDRPHLIQRRAQHLSTGKAVLHQGGVGLLQTLIEAMDFLTQRVGHHALLELAHLLAEYLLEVIGCIHDVGELQTHFRSE